MGGGCKLTENRRIRHRWLPCPVFGLILLLYGTAAQAQTPDCGAILDVDTTLDSNMNCAATAIRFAGAGSDGISLDCAGYSIAANGQGAIVANDVSGISIRNCTIATSENFAHGIFFSNVTHSLVANNSISADGDFARGVEIQRSSNNEFADNEILIFGRASNSLRLRSAANDNLLRRNKLFADTTSAVNIQSSHGNILSVNSLVAPGDFVEQQSLLLHGGGLAIDAAGNAYVAENNVGSTGTGTVNAFIRLLPGLDAIDTIIPLLSGAADVGFGFEALEVLPDGRLLALPDAGPAMALYEIDPNSGQITQIGLNLPVLAGALNGLDSSGNTSMLATTDAGELLDIDLATGNATLIGQQAIGWRDLAVHPTSGQAYAVSRRLAEATGTNHLYQIDPASGQIIAEIGDLKQKFVSDIDFAPDGTLYGINSGQVTAIDLTRASISQVLGLGPDPLEPPSQLTRLINNQMETDDGSILFTNSITLPTELETKITRRHVRITFNRVKVDSRALPFLDAPARITLRGLSNSDRILVYDEDDDGKFETCPPARCKPVSFKKGVLVFEVTGFSTYSTVVVGKQNSDADSNPQAEAEDDSYSGVLSPWMLLLLSIAVMLRWRGARASAGRKVE